MVSLRPRSILQLTIIGFLTVAALLIAALVSSVRELDTLSERSQRAVSEAAGAMRASHALTEQIIAMERNARQYSVLGDKQLLEVYNDRRRDFLDAADTLMRLSINDQINSYITQLVNNEANTFEQLKNIHGGTSLSEDAISAYPLLLSVAYQISRAIDKWIDGQLIILEKQANNTQHLLTIQALFLASTALLLAGLFTALISRPLNQIDRAIKLLGSGSYDVPVQVNGPLDLQELGIRLDWLRTRLAELEQQRTTFLRHVSHELKTPLTAIQEGAALLGEGLVGTLTEQQKEITTILRNNCHRLQKLIENLLRYNLENLSTLKPMPRPVRLDNVIDGVINDHALTIKAGKLHIIRHLEKLTVYGDAEQLRTVIDNLLANAIKYSPTAGNVDISLVRDKSNVVLELCDEGPGIPPAERLLVFEAFYQGRPPDKVQVQGTGLGLAIAMDYAKINNGDIKILDTQKGAKFELRFPLLEKEIA